MSVVTSIMIAFPYSELESDRIKEINNFTHGNRTYSFHWIDDPQNKEPCYTGSKKFNSVILLASFNTFPVDEFLTYLSTQVKWDDPEYVQVFIKSEATNDRSYKIYKNAGAVLIADAEKW